jgi:hypothetical protein
VEGAQGADSPGGAPDTFLPPGASAGFCLGGGGHTTEVASGSVPFWARFKFRPILC